MAKKKAPARIRNGSHGKSATTLAFKGHSATLAGVKTISWTSEMLQIVSTLLCMVTLAGLSTVFANTLAKNDWSIGYFIPTLVAIAITAVADPVAWVLWRLRAACSGPLTNFTGASLDTLSPDNVSGHTKWQHKKKSLNTQISSSSSGIGTEVAEDKPLTTTKLHSSQSKSHAVSTTAKASSSPKGSRSSSPVRSNSAHSATSLDRAQAGGASMDSQRSSGSHSISPKSTAPKLNGPKSTTHQSVVPSRTAAGPKFDPAPSAKPAISPGDCMTDVSQQRKEGNSSGVATKKKRVKRNQAARKAAQEEKANGAAPAVAKAAAPAPVKATTASLVYKGHAFVSYLAVLEAFLRKVAAMDKLQKQDAVSVVCKLYTTAPIGAFTAYGLYPQDATATKGFALLYEVLSNKLGMSVEEQVLVCAKPQVKHSMELFLRAVVANQFNRQKHTLLPLLNAELAHDAKNMAMGDLVKQYVLPLDASNETPAVVKKHSMKILADLLHVSP